MLALLVLIWNNRCVWCNFLYVWDHNFVALLKYRILFCLIMTHVSAEQYDIWCHTWCDTRYTAVIYKYYYHAVDLLENSNSTSEEYEWSDQSSVLCNGFLFCEEIYWHVKYNPLVSLWQSVCVYMMKCLIYIMIRLILYNKLWKW